MTDHRDFDLLQRIEQSGHVLRPASGSEEDRAAFQETVDNLLRLRGLGLVRFPDRRLARDKDGFYTAAGPCDLTPAGIAALSNHRRLAPQRPPS
ncbi:MAG TPA: hypothetical protein VIA81_07290 [Acidimicrobiia bacterium]|jgi:hypothetical protein